MTFASETLSLLAGAEAARTRPRTSRAAVERAIALAPHDAEVRLAAYRFFFYSHDYAAALAEAEVLVVHAARRLNIAADWRAVGAGGAAFTAHDVAPGLYLQALVAIGYCAARLGRAALARAALAKAAELDPTDRFGGGWILGHLGRRDAAEAED